MSGLAKKSGATPGDVVRFIPAPEPMSATVIIGVLAVVELVFVGLFLGGLFGTTFAIICAVLGALIMLLAVLMMGGHAVLKMSGAKLDLASTAGSFAGAAFFLFALGAFCYLGGLSHGNSVEQQQALAVWLGGSMLTLAAILSLYRKYFIPDVMIVKKRKLKYEDLM